MGRDKYATQSLGSLHSNIKKSRVLLVGAGGIGCELLKNLVCTGFGEIHVVDLDTIDLSNLNRQFLFRREHIKKPKALVAKETVSRFNPNVNIVAHHANIKDSQFNIEWFKSFYVVFNALDNMDARRHVNRMCLFADVVLIDSGTTGYLGQVQVIKKGLYQCYDCLEKDPPKSFPVCTIRSTPSQPIHCIVWAKSYLFTEVFGISEETTSDLDHSEDADNADEIEELKRETEELKKIRESMGSDDFPKAVFQKVFKQDIDRLRSMADAWKSRTPPESLDYDKISKAAADLEASVSTQDQKVWTIEENYTVFSDSLKRLSNRLAELRSTANGSSTDVPVLTFDKDDVDTLDFVAASSNLRSMVFGIPTKSKFDIKQMAGNIIPAIATANAMTASLCVLQAFHVLRNALPSARMIYLSTSNPKSTTASGRLFAPNPKCPTCSVAMGQLYIDKERATMNDLVKGVIKETLGYEGEFSILTSAGVVYDPDMEENLPMKLADLGITGDTFLSIRDEEDDEPHVQLDLYVSEKSLPKEAKPVELSEKVEVPRRPKPEVGIDIAIRQANGGTNGVGLKRDAASAGLEDGEARKKGKFDDAKSAETAIVIDDDDGQITID